AKWVYKFEEGNDIPGDQTNGKTAPADKETLKV
uniref:Pyruvate, phosphate dikinase (Fragments) n=1 Tax=Clostridium symbiosum TaxID=1512 RepID=Q7M0I6_CLOSY